MGSPYFYRLLRDSYSRLVPRRRGRVRRCSLMARVKISRRRTHPMFSRRQAEGPARLQEKGAAPGRIASLARGPLRFGRELDLDAPIGNRLDDCISFGSQACGQRLGSGLAGVQFDPAGAQRAQRGDLFRRDARQRIGGGGGGVGGGGRGIGGSAWGERGEPRGGGIVKEL